jgi:uncharacterized protein (TIGR02271 family)
MQVYDADGHLVGTIDRFDDRGFHVSDHDYQLNAIDRIDRDRVYLTRDGATNFAGGSRATSTMAGQRSVAAPSDVRTPDDRGEIRVPVVEERLDVDKRAAQVGEVQVHKTVTEEKKSVPVDLMREEVHVDKHEVKDRPAAPGELQNAFEERTIRVPVRGEEAVARKEAVVTGEVVIDKDRTTQRQDVSDTVRKEHVDVDKDFDRMRGQFQKHFTGANTRTDRTYEAAEPNYRHGYRAAAETRYANRSWDDAEPELRRDWERSARGGDSWEALREEIREGWNRARGD